MECKACGVWFVSDDKSGVCHTCKQTLKNMGLDLQYDHLRELVQADREGRCVVIPCKRYDTLWTFCDYPKSKVYSFKVTDVSTLNGRTMLNTDVLSVVDARDIGKTVFLTREAAEAALKEREKDES